MLTASLHKTTFFLFALAITFSANTTTSYANAIDAPLEPTDSLVMLYGGFESYVRKTDDRMEGPIADFINETAAKAKVNIVWLVAYNKQDILKRQKPNVCYNSFIKTPERITYLKFTAPIGRVPKYVAIASANNKVAATASTLRQLMQDKTLKGLANEDISYGSYIDSLAKDSQFQRSPLKPKRIVALITKGRFDYTILDEVTAKQMVAASTNVDALQIYDHYTDIKGSVEYHIACTKTTSDTLIDKMNSAISTMKILEQ